MAGYPEKVKGVQDALQKHCSATFNQLMVYGELMVLNKHDYESIYKSWLAFGVAIKLEDFEANGETTAQELRANGYLGYANEGVVVISPNDALLNLLHSFEIRTVSAYRPVEISEAHWAEHEGQLIPTFSSMKAFM